jgi:hypothetical protein
VVPGLSSDRRIDGLLYVAEPVHRSLENGHCMVSLTRGNCLQIYIEFECPIVFVNDVTGFSNIVVDINDLESSDGLRDALHINLPTLLTVNLVFDESVSLIRDENLAGRGRLFKPARTDPATWTDAATALDGVSIEVYRKPRRFITITGRRYNDAPDRTNFNCMILRPTRGLRGHRSREVDRRIPAHRQGQLRLVPV